MVRLRNLMGGNTYCRYVWNKFDVCPKLFQDDIKAFNNYVKSANNIIKGLADEYGDNVKFVPIYGYKFSAKDISSIDCFHPSINGQRKIAKITWDMGFFSN